MNGGRLLNIICTVNFNTLMKLLSFYSKTFVRVFSFEQVTKPFMCRSALLFQHKWFIIIKHLNSNESTSMSVLSINLKIKKKPVTFSVLVEKKTQLTCVRFIQQIFNRMQRSITWKQIQTLFLLYRDRKRRECQRQDHNRC